MGPFPVIGRFELVGWVFPALDEVEAGRAGLDLEAGFLVGKGGLFVVVVGVGLVPYYSLGFCDDGRTTTPIHGLSGSCYRYQRLGQ